MKKLQLTIVFYFFAIISVIAQYDRGRYTDFEDEEKMTASDVGFSLAAGAILAVVGYVLMQIKPISGLGKFLVGLGAFLGIGSVVIFLLQIVGMILAATVSFAIKAALVIGAVLLVFGILKGIYNWFTGSNK